MGRSMHVCRHLLCRHLLGSKPMACLQIYAHSFYYLSQNPRKAPSSCKVRAVMRACIQSSKQGMPEHPFGAGKEVYNMKGKCSSVGSTYWLGSGGDDNKFWNYQCAKLSAPKWGSTSTFFKSIWWIN